MPPDDWEILIVLTAKDQRKKFCKLVKQLPPSKRKEKLKPVAEYLSPAALRQSERQLFDRGSEFEYSLVF
jgi:hypothetical protein